MIPACTAQCDEREQLAALIDKLVAHPPCPFVPAGPLYDQLHVDWTDPECYRAVERGSGVVFCSAERMRQLLAECRACVAECVEELAIAAKEDSA